VFNVKATAEDSALDLALAYAESGFSVVPLLRHNKVPPRELGSWERFKSEQPTTEEITKWFQGRDDLVVALVTGKFLVIDADTPEAVTWAANNLPVTPLKVADISIVTLSLAITTSLEAKVATLSHHVT